MREEDETKPCCHFQRENDDEKLNVGAKESVCCSRRQLNGKTIARVLKIYSFYPAFVITVFVLSDYISLSINQSIIRAVSSTEVSGQDSPGAAVMGQPNTIIIRHPRPIYVHFLRCFPRFLTPVTRPSINTRCRPAICWHE